MIQRQVRKRYIIYYMMNVSKDTISKWWSNVEPVPMFKNNTPVTEFNNKVLTLLLATLFGFVGGIMLTVVFTSATLAIITVYNPVIGSIYLASVAISMLILLYRRV